MKSNLSLIIKREYLERVSRKSFIITTILMPLLMLGLMAAPALVMLMSGPENKQIAVIDQSGVIVGQLKNTDEIKFMQLPSSVSFEQVKNKEADNNYDAVLIIGEDIVDNDKNVQLYTFGAPSMQTEEFITGQLDRIIEDKRIERYNIENLAEIMRDVQAHSRLTTYRLDTDEAEETSSIVSYLIGIVMAMMLYMFIMIYGNIVMNSIIEEKNNRVLEIIVSSVKPKTLMMGKILGIGLVALTQIFIWGVLISAFSFWGIGAISKSVGPDADADLMVAISQLGDTGRILTLFGYIVLFLIGGYLLYSSFYAAIGSAVDNVQDASQLSSISLAPIILGMIMSMSVVNDPTSSLAFWFSIIPLTSPMVMVARIPFNIPAWEIWLSLGLLCLAFLFMIWLTAKIYRVGIFMYGKKPSISDLIKWARYK